MRGRARKIALDEGFRHLVEELEAWKIPDDALDGVHDAARASLAEVKALTEYEDGKASRLLTVVAFLSAVVGAVFTRFSTIRPWPGLSKVGIHASWVLPAATYAAFFVYLMLVTTSTFIIIGAIRPTFNAPATWRGRAGSGSPRSMLFYQGILDVRPTQWGRAFVAKTGAGDAKELKSTYAKCYIQEAYLVAGKVAEKLERLAPGVWLLRVAMLVLAVFFALFAATIVSGGPAAEGGRSPDPSPHPPSTENVHNNARHPPLHRR